MAARGRLAHLGGLLGAHGDGQLHILGALGAPGQDAGAAQGHQAQQVLTAGQAAAETGTNGRERGWSGEDSAPFEVVGGKAGSCSRGRRSRLRHSRAGRRITVGTTGSSWKAAAGLAWPRAQRTRSAGRCSCRTGRGGITSAADSRLGNRLQMVPCKRSKGKLARDGPASRGNGNIQGSSAASRWALEPTAESAAAWCYILCSTAASELPRVTLLLCSRSRRSLFWGEPRLTGSCPPGRTCPSCRWCSPGRCKAKTEDQARQKQTMRVCATGQALARAAGARCSGSSGKLLQPAIRAYAAWCWRWQAFKAA